LRIAEIVSAKVVVIAVDWSVLARSSDRIAGVLRAGVVVIARDWSGRASSIDASNSAARNGLADNISAGIASAGGKLSENASSGVGGGIARIGCARIVVVADLCQTLATSGSDAVVICAWVVVIAGDVGEHTSSSNSRIASVGCAEVAVRANFGSRCASVSSLASDTSISCAFVVVIANIWANASCTTRAESKTSLSARIAWNINASGNDKTVQNGAELSKAWSGEHGLNAGKLGGNESHFVDIITSDSDGEHNRTRIVYTCHSRTEVNSVSVSFTISHEDNDLGNVGSAVSCQLCLSS
jgi:hypothetical protein